MMSLRSQFTFRYASEDRATALSCVSTIGKTTMHGHYGYVLIALIDSKAKSDHAQLSHPGCVDEEGFIVQDDQLSSRGRMPPLGTLLSHGIGCELLSAYSLFRMVLFPTPEDPIKQ